MKNLNLEKKEFYMVYNNSFFNNAPKNVTEDISAIGPKSRNWFALMKRYGGLEHWIPRFGNFDTPWKSNIDDVRITYDPNFNRTYADICDQRALDIKNILDNDPKKTVTVFWSGGVDSTVVLTALLKNLGKSYYDRLSIA